LTGFGRLATACRTESALADDAAATDEPMPPLTKIPSLGALHDQRLLPWALLALGLSAMYVPSVLGLLNGLWATEQNAHGPLVLAVAAWYFYFKGRQIYLDPTTKVAPAPLAGWCAFGIGLAAYIIGRSQQFHLLEVGSMLPLVLGGALIAFGWPVVRRLWFAFFFLLFVIPLPGSVVDALTQPMKIIVSWAAEALLYNLGYPVARSGVMISIGPYQLLVADACAGLNSLFTLEAVGLLYINVVRHESPLRNAVLAVLIVPISFASNITRVVLLSLVTFHWGDEAGQGFLHVSSGLALFLVALVLIIGLDALLTVIARFWHTRVRPQRAAVAGTPPP
jgi:exosortase B